MVLRQAAIVSVLPGSDIKIDTAWSMKASVSCPKMSMTIGKAVPLRITQITPRRRRSLSVMEE